VRLLTIESAIIGLAADTLVVISLYNTSSFFTLSTRVDTKVLYLVLAIVNSTSN